MARAPIVLSWQTRRLAGRVGGSNRRPFCSLCPEWSQGRKNSLRNGSRFFGLRLRMKAHIQYLVSQALPYTLLKLGHDRPGYSAV